MAMSAVTLTLVCLFGIFPTLTDATTEEPSVELIATKKDIPVGSTGLLFCKANKAATFTWQKDGEDLEDRIESDEEKSRLTLRDVTLSDSGNYTCLGDFDGTEREQFISIFVYETPSFGSTKTYHEFLVNKTVHVPCMVTGKPEVETNWYWNGVRVLNNDTSNLKVLPDGTLQIINIQRENHGTYNCEGKIKGRPKSEILNISVVVNVPPTVIVRSEKPKVVAGPSQNFTLTCLVTGAPHPNITWETPDTSDSSRYIYNSDKSMLFIPGVVRSDSGKYVCTASNKIGEDSTAFTLDVLEIPSVSLSKSEMVVKPGDSASVICSATGHPKPSIQWLNKSNKGGMSSTGRVRVMASQLQIENVVPSDGGVYSCKATNEAGSNTHNFMLLTSPEVPTLFTLSPGPSAFHITLQKSIQDGNSPISQYVIQWRNESQDDWNEIAIPYSNPLKVSSLESYTEYFVRFAAKNKHFLGGFSAEGKIHTLARREPDKPEVFADESKIEKNTYSVPFKQLNDGGSPVTHYVVRYRMKKDGEPWREKETDANSSRIALQNLEYETDYEAELIAVNINGFSKPVKIYFTIPQAQHSLGKGGVVAIVLVIFLFITMNGLEKSVPKLQTQNKTGTGLKSDITCDKAPLTKFE
ncbi:Neural cell adhesion molecule 1 [Bagarius yarrelli]|uniref:Neural cell adhesion molecule 1 n=1 Tax=Bagarius yarrelli TaxID=175774 RepID=A0A556TLY0_BAGYA|nr:Neural cell adhesion molecule 1 [Bagarius yarrelli]